MSTSDLPTLPEQQHERRSHDFYPSPLQPLPNLYATDDVSAAQKVIAAHYSLRACNCWICEYDPQTGEAFGNICLGDAHKATGATSR